MYSILIKFLDEIRALYLITSAATVDKFSVEAVRMGLTYVEILINLWQNLHTWHKGLIPTSHWNCRLSIILDIQNQAILLSVSFSVNTPAKKVFLLTRVYFVIYKVIKLSENVQGLAFCWQMKIALGVIYLIMHNIFQWSCYLTFLWEVGGKGVNMACCWSNHLVNPPLNQMEILFFVDFRTQCLNWIHY